MVGHKALMFRSSNRTDTPFFTPQASTQLFTLDVSEFVFPLSSALSDIEIVSNEMKLKEIVGNRHNCKQQYSLTEFTDLRVRKRREHAQRR